MSVLNKKKIEKSLKKKGFKLASGDHRYFVFCVDDKSIRTKISHGSKKDIDNYLISKMSQQTYLLKKEFIDLINCPLSIKKYREILKLKNIV